MSEGSANTSGQTGFIRGPQDFWGGLVLVAVALFVFWSSADLAGMRGFSFGPGTAPRLCATLMLGLGIAVSVSGLLIKGEPLRTFAVRGPLMLTVSIIFFAMTIRLLGLVVTSYVSFMIAAFGSHETRWLETAILGAALTIFCALLFPYGLGLPFQLWPAFIQ